MRTVGVPRGTRSGRREPSVSSPPRPSASRVRPTSCSRASSRASAAAAATFDPANFQGKRIGEIFDFAGPVANIPTGAIQVPTAATNISRSTYSALFAALTVQVTGNTTSGNATISGVSADTTATVVAGMPISGPGIQAGATVSSVTSTTIVLSAAATATAAGVAVVIAPWGVGDGSTTFGCPYVPTDYATVHNPTASAKTTVGQLISHSHVQSGQTLVSTGGGLSGGSNYATGSESTQATGGAANLPAGSRVIKCLQVS